jgi:predicted nuclease of predicted toxin-antitoxin system
MRVLLDECLPRKLGRLLADHEVQTVQQSGWSSLRNGELLDRASHQFDVLITIDSSIPFQQNLDTTRMALVVLSAQTNRIEDVAPLVPQILDALQTIKPGDVVRIPS